MKLILKIAVGVFLGVGAILVAMNLAGRIARAKQETAAKAHAEAETRQLDEELQPLLPHTLSDMTPEDLIAHCGKPAKDETATDEDLTSRVMTYRISPHRKINVLFAANDPRLGFKGAWRLAGFTSIQDQPPSVDSSLTGFDEKAAIRAMPCMNAR
jgi:hypothetical protein